MCPLYNSFFLPSFLSIFFLILTSFYLTVVGVEGYCCTWSHSMTHTHKLSRTPLDEELAFRRDLSTWKHTTLTGDRHLCPQQDSNPKSQQANARRPTH